MSESLTTGWLNDRAHVAPLGKKKTSKRVITKSTQEGCKEGETRATFIFSEDHLEKIRNLAYWEGKEFKKKIAEILNEYFTRYERKNGAIKQREG